MHRNPKNKITINKDAAGTKIKFHEIKLAGIEQWDIRNSNLNSRVNSIASISDAGLNATLDRS